MKPKKELTRASYLQWNWKEKAKRLAGTYGGENQLREKEWEPT